MIVLDEQISQESIRRSFGWYPGRVAFVKELRPRTLIDDDAVPAILRLVRQPTFVTINVEDFWRVAQADHGYCIVCLPLRQQQAGEASSVVRRLFHLPYFSSRALRMGKVILVASDRVVYYESTGWIVSSIFPG